MTCIVGVQQDGEVYIGGDSAGVGGYDITIRADQKVFRNGPFVMGFTTSFRMGQLLRYAFTPPQITEKDLDKYMAVEFVNAVRQCLKDGGYLTNNSGNEEGGTFLVGVQGQLYSIHNDFQIGRSRDGYLAVGCGDDYALGSLFSSSGQDAKSRVRLALNAASHHSAGVVGPYTILKTKD